MPFRAKHAEEALATLHGTASTSTHLEPSLVGKLSTLDRFLPLWIGLAMAAGLVLGRIVPDLNEQLDRVKVGETSLPIAIGLLGMMYPVLAKVRYNRLREVTADRPLVASSLVLNWLIGPALMFALAWVFLPDLPEFRTGVILVGLARCIAMVLIWNSLACGDTEAGAVLVVLNSVFQVAAYAFLGYFYLQTLPGWLPYGVSSARVKVSRWRASSGLSRRPRKWPKPRNADVYIVSSDRTVVSTGSSRSSPLSMPSCSIWRQAR